MDPGLSVLINSQADSDTGKLRGGSAIENGRESGFLSFVHHIFNFFRSVVLSGVRALAVLAAASLGNLLELQLPGPHLDFFH